MIKWWQGTDALKLNMYPPGNKIWYIRIFLERIYWRIMWRFYTHYINTKKLERYLVPFGIPREKLIFRPVPHNVTKYEKIPHKNFIVMWYLPKRKRNQKYKDWIYGRDYYNEVKKKLWLYTDIKFLELDGSRNMKEIYPFVDLYIKINRAEGSDLNRIAKECKINDIPVYAQDCYYFTFCYNVEQIRRAIYEHWQAKSSI